MLGEGAWLPNSHRILGRKEVMGSSCSSSIQQPQTVSKARLVSMLTTPAIFHQQEQVTFILGAACLKQSAFLPPPTQEQTRLFGRGLALLHHNTLAKHKRTYLASIAFLVAFHLHICEKLIHLCIQLVFVEFLQCTRHCYTLLHPG